MLAPLELDDYIAARSKQRRLEAKIRELEAQLAQALKERDAVLEKAAKCRWCNGEFQ